MAIWFAPGQNQGIQAELRADGTADVANLEAFAAANFLKPGSTCLVIQESNIYMMQSDGSWSAL